MSIEELMKIRERSKKEVKQIIDDMLLFKNQLEKTIDKNSELLNENRLLKEQIKRIDKVLDIIENMSV